MGIKFDKMVARVRRVDSAAADYLRDEVGDPRGRQTGNLDEAMVWDETPQGNAFWRQMFITISNLPKEPGLFD